MGEKTWQHFYFQAALFKLNGDKKRQGTFKNSTSSIIHTWLISDTNYMTVFSGDFGLTMNVYYLFQFSCFKVFSWTNGRYSPTVTPSHLVTCSINSFCSRAGRPFQDVSRGGSVWEGVLFHLALLLCARQVVKRREGEREREGGIGRKKCEGGIEGCRMEREKVGEKGQRRCVAILQLSVRLTHRSH